MAVDYRKRKPLMSSPNFHQRLEELQKKIRKKTGENPSLTDLTERMAQSFDVIENSIINLDFKKIDLRLNLDRRKK